MDRQRYQSDLSSADWETLVPHLPVPKLGGRPRIHSIWEVLDAIFWVAYSGCAWRLLPHDFPPWKTVYHYFRSWRLNGTCVGTRRGGDRLEEDPPAAGLPSAAQEMGRGADLLVAWAEPETEQGV